MRIALIGCGRWGRNILRDLLELGAEVQVVDPDENVRKQAQQLNAEACATVGELNPVDGVVIATPTSLHAESIMECAALNVPIFCEKPLCDSLAKAEHVAELVGERLFVMDKWRYHRGVTTLAEHAKSGKYGRILGLETVRVQFGMPHRDVDTVWILCPHELSIADEILGSIPEPISAIAHSIFVDGESTPVGRMHITDMFAVLGKDPWYSMRVSSTTAERKRLVRVYLEKAVLELSDPDNDFLEIIHNKDMNVDSPPRDYIRFENLMPLQLELKAFIGYLEGGPAPKATAKDGISSIEAIEKLRQLSGDPAVSAKGA